MSTELAKVKKLFESFYSSTYHRARILKDKNFKDVVGEEYEAMRRDFYISFGFKAEKEIIGHYEADLVVRDSKTNEVLAIEEDKGHYVDSCFMKRFLSDAAEIINSNLQEGVATPTIVLSSPTNMGNYKEAYECSSRLFRPEIKKVMDEKIVYLPYCTHGRVSRAKYYKNKSNCFALSDELITKQLELIKTLKQGGNNVV